MRKLILLLILPIFFSSCNNYEKLKEGKEIKTADFSQSIDNRFRNYNNHKKPGYAILIMKDGEVVHSAGYGMANFEEKKPILPETKFSSWLLFIESVNLTALDLIIKGEIDESKPVTHYLSFLPEEFNKLKVEHLIKRSSGLNRPEKMKPEEYKNSRTTAEFIGNSVEFLNEPGDSPGFTGSESEFQLLAAIIEEVTSTPIHEYLESNLYKRAGLKNTTIENNQRPETGELKNYKRRSDKLIPRDNNRDLSIGVETTFTTLEDIAIWYRALDYEELFPQEVMDKFHQHLIEDYENRYKDHYTGYLTLAGYKSVIVSDESRSTIFGDDDMISGYYPDAGYRVFLVSNLPDAKANNSLINTIQPIILE